MKIYTFKLLTLFFIALSFTSQAATITAISSGDWATASNWNDGVPGNGDEIIIPSGIEMTYTGNLNGNAFGSIEILGTLTVSGSVNYSEWEGDVITVRNGGIMYIGVDLYFLRGNNGQSFIVEAGGEAYVGNNISDASSGIKALSVSGFLEVDGTITTTEINITIAQAGVLVVHTNITGSGGSPTILNNGIITADNNLVMNDITIHNTETGRFLVFGDITLMSSGRYLNYGFVQTNNFIFNNVTAFENYGTTVVLETFDVNWTGCPCNLGDFYLNDFDLSNPGAGAGICGSSEPSCDAYWASQNKIEPGRRLWLSADFLGYGLANDGDRVYRWFDYANTFGFNMSQSNVANRPVLKNNATDNLNFNPTIGFDELGDDILSMNIASSAPVKTLYSNSADPDKQGFAMFSVVVPSSGGVADQLMFDYGSYNTAGYGLLYSNQNAKVYTPNLVTSSSPHGRGEVPTIVSHNMNWDADPKEQALYLDGVQIPPVSSVTISTLDASNINHGDTPTATNGPLTLGKNSTTSITNEFDGRLAELIVYARKITTDELEATQSYLALKYGITVPHAYRDFLGNIVRDVDATFNNDIAGLGREDIGMLHQKKSKSINSGAELTISVDAIDNAVYNQKAIATRISNNTSYLIWGHNGETVESGNRTYKITASNFKQQVYMQFEIPADVSASTLLVIADNPTFSSNVISLSPTEYSNPNLKYTYQFPNNKTVYFKVLSLSGVASEPGVGINTETIDPTAELHINSNSKGLLLPALVSEASITEPPTEGLIFYNTTHKRFMYYDGTVWKFVGEPLKQTTVELDDNSGYYTGEIRYNTTTNTLWMWDGTVWVQLKNN